MRRIFVLLMLSGLMALLTACSASTANIQSVELAKGYENGNAVNPTTTFAPTDTIHAVVQIANAPEDTKVRAAWTAVDVGAAAPKGKKIDEKELLTKDIGSSADFSLAPSSPFPPGQYKVDIYLNDVLNKTLEFTVQ